MTSLSEVSGGAGAGGGLCLADCLPDAGRALVSVACHPWCLNKPPPMLTTPTIMAPPPTTMATMTTLAAATDDDDDSRSRSHSPRDRRRRVTDSQVVDRIAAVVVAHMQDDYTARLEDRLYVDLQLFLYLHSSHISHIYNISTFCR